MTLDQALGRLAERTYDNTRMLKQARRQRRTEYTDIYGIPLESESASNTDFEYHIFISSDLEYWERFQFKLNVMSLDGSDITINPSEFTVKVREVDEETGEPTSSIDLTDYLIEQHDSWITGNGYYPAEEIGDDSPDAEDFFDVLDASILIWEQGRTTSYNRLLEAGTKIVLIHSPVACRVQFIPYIKYSTVNR